MFECVGASDCRFLGASWRCDAEDLRENSETEALVCVPN